MIDSISGDSAFVMLVPTEKDGEHIRRSEIDVVSGMENRGEKVEISRNHASEMYYKNKMDPLQAFTFGDITLQQLLFMQNEETVKT